MTNGGIGLLKPAVALVRFSNVSHQCRISAHFNDLFGVVAARAERPMMEVLAKHNVAICLETILSFGQLKESMLIVDYTLTARLPL